MSLDTLHRDTITTPSPDGIPDGMPYLWTIFFRADGSTLRVSTGAKVVSTAVVESTPTNREDLGSHGVALGSSVSIPSVIGWWSAATKPIPVEVADTCPDDALAAVIGTPETPAAWWRCWPARTGSLAFSAKAAWVSSPRALFRLTVVAAASDVVTSTGSCGYRICSPPAPMIAQPPPLSPIAERNR